MKSIASRKGIPRRCWGGRSAFRSICIPLVVGLLNFCIFMSSSSLVSPCSSIQLSSLSRYCQASPMATVHALPASSEHLHHIKTDTRPRPQSPSVNPERKVRTPLSPGEALALYSPLHSALSTHICSARCASERHRKASQRWQYDEQSWWVEPDENGKDGVVKYRSTSTTPPLTFSASPSEEDDDVFFLPVKQRTKRDNGAAASYDVEHPGIQQVCSDQIAAYNYYERKSRRLSSQEYGLPPAVSGAYPESLPGSPIYTRSPEAAQRPRLVELEGISPVKHGHTARIARKPVARSHSGPVPLRKHREGRFPNTTAAPSLDPDYHNIHMRKLSGPISPATANAEAGIILGAPQPKPPALSPTPAQRRMRAMRMHSDVSFYACVQN